MCKTKTRDFADSADMALCTENLSFIDTFIGFANKTEVILILLGGAGSAEPNNAIKQIIF